MAAFVNLTDYQHRTLRFVGEGAEDGTALTWEVLRGTGCSLTGSVNGDIAIVNEPNAFSWGDNSAVVLKITRETQTPALNGHYRVDVLDP